MSQLFNDPTATLKSELRKLKAENTSLRQKLAAAMQQVKAPPPPIMASDETALLSRKVGNQTDLIKVQGEELNKLRRELERAKDKITSVHKEYSDKATQDDKERSAAESKMIEKMRLMEKKLRTREAKLEAVETELVKLRGEASEKGGVAARSVVAAAATPPTAAMVVDPAEIERVRRMEELLAHLKDSISSFEGGAGSFSSTSRIIPRKAVGQKRVRSPTVEASSTPGGSPGISNHLQHDVESSAQGTLTVPVTIASTAAEPKRRGRPPKAKSVQQQGSTTTTPHTPTAPTITITKLTAEEFGDNAAPTLRVGNSVVEFSGDAISKYLGFSRLSSALEAKALASALVSHFNGNKSEIVSKLVSHIACVHSCSFRVSVTKGVRALHILVADIAPLGIGEALMGALTTAALGVMGGDSAVAIDHSGQGVAFGHTIRILSESLHSLAVAASKAASATAADRINMSRFALLPTLAAYDCVVAYQHTRNHERSNIHLSHAFPQLLSFVGGLLYEANGSTKEDTPNSRRSPLSIAVQYTVAEAMKEWKQSADSRASPRLAPQGEETTDAVGVYALYQDVCEAAKWSGQVCPGGLPQLLGTLLSKLQSLEPTYPATPTTVEKASHTSQSLLNGKNWGLCTEPYKQLQMAARLVILSCGFSLGYQQVLEVGSASGSAFRDASTIELLALIVNDFGILDDNSLEEESKARLESIVGLFKEYLTSPDEGQQYFTLSAQSTVSNVVLDRNTAASSTTPARGLFATLGSPFDPAAVKVRSQKAITELVI